MKERLIEDEPAMKETRFFSFFIKYFPLLRPFFRVCVSTVARQLKEKKNKELLIVHHMFLQKFNTFLMNVLTSVEQLLSVQL